MKTTTMRVRREDLEALARAAGPLGLTRSGAASALFGWFASQDHEVRQLITGTLAPTRRAEARVRLRRSLKSGRR